MRSKLRYLAVVMVCAFWLGACGGSQQEDTGDRPAADRDKQGAQDCALSRSEVSSILGVKMRPTSASSAKAGSLCGYDADQMCPCGDANYGEVQVLVATVGGDLAEQRTTYAARPPGLLGPPAEVIDRPDLGPGAFALRDPGGRGATAGLPLEDGYAVVTVGLGTKELSAPPDRRGEAAFNKLFSLVHQRLR